MKKHHIHQHNAASPARSCHLPHSTPSYHHTPTPPPCFCNDALASPFACYYAALSNRSFAGEAAMELSKSQAEAGPWGGPGAQTHLPNADRGPCEGGDAGQGAALPALGVSHHPAVSALQRDLPKLHSLSTRNTRFWLDNLVMQSTQMGEVSAV